MGSGSETTSHLSPERFCQTPEPDASPNKRPKTLAQSPNSSSSSKGKDKICDESELVDSESQCCGICLSEDQRVIRGWIESCDHYFCFVCIMEWAKVESRCPLCKRRFSTIRRPPVDGLFLAERIVNVPVRDQVYHIYGNATVAHQDPYSLTKCTLCNSDGDENLLLLCDLCDSAAHTYCVGLGATVPDGDWFCQDCTVSRAEHSKSETDAKGDSQDSLNNSNQTSFGETNVSLRDIVRETVRSRTTVLSNPSGLSSTTVPDRRATQASSLTRQNPRTHPTVAATATDLGARTVRRCRNVQSRIRDLRENWNAFRSGNLRFSSSSVGFSGNTNQISINCNNLPNRSGRSLSTPPSSQQSPIQNGSSLNTTPNRSSYNEAKAWKMLNAAKSLERSRQKPNLIHQRLTKSEADMCMPIKTDNLSSSAQASSCKALKMGISADGLHQRHYQCHSLVKETRSHKSQVLPIQKQLKFEKVSKFGESSSIQAPGKHQLPSSVKVRTSIQANVGLNNFGKPSEQSSRATSSDVCTVRDRSAPRLGSAAVASNVSLARLGDSSVQANDSKNNIEKLSEERFHATSAEGCTVGNRSVCWIPQAGSATEASNTTSARLENYSSSELDLPPINAKEPSHAGSKSRADDDDDAKVQIQFLVKLNLKLVTRDKKLEVDTFKEIARLCTHSILAACGLKQPKPGARSFPTTACLHMNQVLKPRTSTLMPSLCIECFHVFVKDVVETIMSEKIDSIKRSSR